MKTTVVVKYTVVELHSAIFYRFYRDYNSKKNMVDCICVYSVFSGQFQQLLSRTIYKVIATRGK